MQDFDLGLGCGFVFSNSRAKFYLQEKLNMYMRGVSRNIGLSFYASGSYNVAKNLSVNLTVNPDVYLYNYSAEYEHLLDSDAKENRSFEASGMRFGFAFNASLGVSYTF